MEACCPLGPAALEVERIEPFEACVPGQTGTERIEGEVSGWSGTGRVGASEVDVPG